MRKVTVEVNDPNKYISSISVVQNPDIVMIYVDSTARGKRKIQDCMFEDGNIIRIFNSRTKVSTMLKIKNLPFRMPVVRQSGAKHALFIHYIRRSALGRKIVYSQYED